MGTGVASTPRCDSRQAHALARVPLSAMGLPHQSGGERNCGVRFRDRQQASIADAHSRIPGSPAFDDDGQADCPRTSSVAPCGSLSRVARETPAEPKGSQVRIIHSPSLKRATLQVRTRKHASTDDSVAQAHSEVDKRKMTPKSLASAYLSLSPAQHGLLLRCHRRLGDPAVRADAEKAEYFRDCVTEVFRTATRSRVTKKKTGRSRKSAASRSAR